MLIVIVLLYYDIIRFCYYVPYFCEVSIVMSIFDYSISNPPYQVLCAYGKNGRPMFTRIYDDMQKAATSISDNTVMIYPASWQRSLTLGYSEWLIHNGVHEVYNYDGQDVFGKSITKDYPVCVLSQRNNYTGNIYVNDYTNTRNDIVWIDDKIKSILINATNNYEKYSIKARDLSTLKNIETSQLEILPEDHNDKHPVTIYIKQSQGTQVDAADREISMGTALKYFSREDIEGYLVSMPSSFFKQYRMLKATINNPKKNFGFKTYSENHVHGQTYKNILRVDTREEADKLVQYFNSRIITLLIAYSSKLSDVMPLVPRIDVTTSPINWNDDIDEQLYELFGLSEENKKILRGK